MPDTEVWERRKVRAGALAREAVQLCEELTGATSAERQYKTALRQAAHHANRAEEVAGIVKARLERRDKRRDPGPSRPSSDRNVMMVKFACEMLGWMPKTMIEESGVSPQVCRNFLNGNYCGAAAVNAMLQALVKHGIDVEGLDNYMAAFFARRGQEGLPAGAHQPERSAPPPDRPRSDVALPAKGDSERPLPWR